MKRLLYILFYLLAAASLFAVSPSSVDPDQLMQAKNYKGALKIYRSMLNNGKHKFSYRIYYNAGGAAVKSGKYGLAVLYYERARVIYDGDFRLARNIQIAKARSGANRLSLRAHSMIRFIFFFYFSFSRASLLTMLFVLAAILLLFISMGYFFSFFSRRFFKIASLCLITLLIITTISMLAKNVVIYEEERAIVIKKDAGLFQSRLEDSPLIARIPAAVEVSIKLEKDGMVRIVLPGGASGWMKSELLERIHRE